MDDEEMPDDASPQIKQFVADGIRIREALPTFALKAYAAADLARFDPKLVEIGETYIYKVILSPKLSALTQGNDVNIHLDRE